MASAKDALTSPDPHGRLRPLSGDDEDGVGDPSPPQAARLGVTRGKGAQGKPLQEVCTSITASSCGSCA